ncbi:hypothetical protein PTI98_002039 [Pleurotus ostreatus]|nr:hypothetical protein PTI98_002039 [Pleurotus ostreatus]
MFLGETTLTILAHTWKGIPPGPRTDFLPPSLIKCQRFPSSICLPEMTWMRPKWTGEQRRALFQRLDEGPEQWETFDPYLAERLTKVGRLMVQDENLLCL